MHEWLRSNDGLVAAIQVLVFFGALALSARVWLRSLREMGRSLLWGLLGLALCSSLLSFLAFAPEVRWEALGHEASYVDCFLGRADPSGSEGWEGYVTYPLLRWGYWALGGLLGRGDPLALIGLNLLARGWGVFALGWLAFLIFRSRSISLAAATLLLLHPWHSMWAATAFNVMLPLGFGLLFLVCVVLALGTGSASTLLAASASLGLVVGLRVEFGLFVLPALCLLASLGSKWGRAPAVTSLSFWCPSVVLGLITAWALFAGPGELTEQGGYHGLWGYLATVGRQFWILGLLEPLGGVLGITAISLALLWATGAQTGKERVAWGLLAWTVSSHLTLATFNDYGFRQALVPSLGLILLLASLAEPLCLSARKLERLVAGIALLAVVFACLQSFSDVATRYYADGSEFSERHLGFAGPNLPAQEVEDGRCYLISDDEGLWERGLAGSHFNLMDPAEAVHHWRGHQGCVLWLLDRNNYRVDALAVRPRVLKLREWFDWELLGWTELGSGLKAAVYRMTGPPYGIGYDAPVPETEFLLEDEGAP